MDGEKVTQWRRFDREKIEQDAPAVLPLVEAINNIVIKRLNDIERMARRLEAEGRKTAARTKRSEGSHYEFSKINYAVGKNTIEQLFRGKLVRIPERDVIDTLVTYLDCNRQEKEHLLAEGGYASVRRHPRLVSLSDRLPHLRVIMDALPFPACVVDHASRPRAVNALCSYLWQLSGNSWDTLEETVAALGDVLAFATAGHIVDVPLTVNLLALRLSIGTDDSPLIIAFAPFDDPAVTWFEAVGLSSPVPVGVTENEAGASLASSLLHFPPSRTLAVSHKAKRNDEARYEAQLITVVRTGNEAAFAELMERSIRYVFRLTYGLTADVEEAVIICEKSYIRVWREILDGRYQHRSFTGRVAQLAVTAGMRSRRAKGSNG